MSHWVLQQCQKANTLIDHLTTKTRDKPGRWVPPEVLPGVPTTPSGKRKLQSKWWSQRTWQGRTSWKPARQPEEKNVRVALYAEETVQSYSHRCHCRDLLLGCTSNQKMLLAFTRWENHILIISPSFVQSNGSWSWCGQQLPELSEGLDWAVTESILPWHLKAQR